jgi:hypothetical protein
MLIQFHGMPVWLKMTVRPTIHERAFQLTAECDSIPAIRRRLMSERYDSVDAHLAAPMLRLTLKRMCRSATKLRLFREKV